MMRHGGMRSAGSGRNGDDSELGDFGWRLIVERSLFAEFASGNPGSTFRWRELRPSAGSTRFCHPVWQETACVLRAEPTPLCVAR
jgi:hypothetical protein